MALFISAIYSIFLPQFEKNVFETKKTAIKDNVEIAITILQNYHTKFTQGILSEEKAQEQAIETIRTLRFGLENKDYFWLQDMDATMIMHPYRSSMEGTDLSNYQGEDSVRIFQDFADLVDSLNEGYSYYLWQWYGDSTAVVPKISYVKEFEAWGWIVGTGVYLNDFQDTVSNLKKQLLNVSAGLVVMFLLILLFSIQQNIVADKKRLKAENKIIALNQDLEKQVGIIKESKKRAEKSDQLKDVFLQNLSHEVRTPLNAIVGFSGLLKNEIQTLSKNQLEDYTSVISQNSDQLLTIVSDILTISSIQTGLEPAMITKVDVNQVLKQVISSFLPIAQNNKILLTLNSPSSRALYIQTDKTKLTQIISNLVNNAIKYTPEGSVEITCEIKKDSLLFMVSDSGIGIDKKHHLDIFERFRQVKNNEKAYTGTGLGLSICKSFAEIIKGKIWVESSPGIGSIFFLSIPYTETDKALAHKKTQPKHPIRKINNTIKQILVAEDELYNFKLIEAILRSDAFKCIHAENGIKAVEICKNNPEIELVLMDIKMPEMDGETAFHEIQKIRPNLPIIAQTAYAMETDKMRFLEIGFTNYVSKPIKRLELLEKINKALKA